MSDRKCCDTQQTSSFNFLSVCPAVRLPAFTLRYCSFLISVSHSHRPKRQIRLSPRPSAASPSFPSCLPTSFFFHSSSNPITLAASSFVKELQSCGAVKTSPPDVQSTWLEKDSGACGGDLEGGADWYQLIKETPRILCFLFFFPWLAGAKPCDPWREWGKWPAKDHRK